MKIKVETERLLIRELQNIDENDFFEMDSDPEVHKYIDNNPVKTIEEVRATIEIFKKYETIFAVVDKNTNECIGWSGLRFCSETINNKSNFYELGYRFKRKHWGKGFATESGKAIINFGFANMKIDKIIAVTNAKNENSKKVLHKLNFSYVESFIDEGQSNDWFELKNQTF